MVILRRVVKTDLALSRRTEDQQIELLMPDKDVEAWGYTVLVSSSAYPLEVCGQLYPDRADCENVFDELKNQWGWGGSRAKTLSAAKPVRVPWRCSITGGLGTVHLTPMHAATGKLMALLVNVHAALSHSGQLRSSYSALTAGGRS